MKDYCFIYIIATLQVALCLIPGLVVKKLDKTLIARKRQDTMDMCRLFTEENKKLQHSHNQVPKIIKSYTGKNKPFRRSKRDISEESLKESQRHKGVNEESHRYKRGINENTFKKDLDPTMKYSVNPALNPEDAKRVESIVDKLYDEMEEKGERVTYRQVRTTSSVKVFGKNKTFLPSRRFDFAPAFLTGPQHELKQPKGPDDEPFPSKARWKLGIVPYYIDFKTYDAHLSEMIVKSFDYVEKATCIRLQKLRERPTDKESLESVPWLYISNPTGIRQCVHSNEKRRVNGVVMTVFGYDCMSLGDIVHETMHILGFSHEHLRSDRDQHISIIWENIKPGYKKFFDLNIMGSEYELESLPYDYSSILHYPPRAFSKNGKVTIMTEYGLRIGQREGLSEIDVEKVSLIYSNECVKRNREYLLQTCPSVVKASTKPINITQKEIDAYFRDRLWAYGIVNYKFRDRMEFSVEERENIKTVFRHIEQETCIQFRDAGTGDDEDSNKEQMQVAEKDRDNRIDTNAPMNSIEKSPIDEEVTPIGTEVDPTIRDAYIPAQQTQTEDKIDDNEYKPDLLAQDSDTDVKSGKKQPEIISTQLIGRINAEDANNIEENEIQKSNAQSVKDDELLGSNTGMDLKKMNLTMKKALLRRAKKRRIRTRRDTKSHEGPRRHANAILVLSRTAGSRCPCPKSGAPSGDQVLEIAAGCFNSVNDLLHYFVHVLGLDHQHNMHDRDNYLHIVWSNLTDEVRNEMENKLPPAASVGFSYDYQSVMHYPWLQIKDGKTNIMFPIWNDGWAMGHWQGLSSVDVQKLNLLYFTQCMERSKQEKQ